MKKKQNTRLLRTIISQRKEKSTLAKAAKAAGWNAIQSSQALGLTVKIIRDQPYRINVPAITKTPKNKKIIGCANSLKASSAGAKFKKTAATGIINPVSERGIASVIHNTATITSKANAF